MHRGVVATFLALTVQSSALAQDDAVRGDNHAAADEFVISVGPVDLPAGGHHHHGAYGAVFPPIATVEVPFEAYFYSLRYEIVDGDGTVLPTDLLHHLNLMDPDHRELFLPIARRIAAVSEETPPIEMPPELMALPMETGDRIEVSVMLHNPTPTDYQGVTVRVHLGYVPAEEGRPEFEVYPFHLDVAFPAGDKAFDVPPGRHWWSNEGRPVVPGVIMGVGAHYHDWVEHIVLEDVTAGEILWVGCPVLEPAGEVERSTFGRFYEQYEAVPGIEVTPEHVYRVTVTYDNRSGARIPDGGMGVVAGVFVPADGVTWPRVDRDAPLYELDRRHYLRQIRGTWAEIAGTLAADSTVSTIEMDAPPSPALKALEDPCPWIP